MTTKNQLLNRKGLADGLNCSRATTYRLEEQGLIPPPILIGSMKRWDWEEVKSTFQRQKNTPAAADIGEGL